MDAFFRTLPGVFEAIDASDEVRSAFVFAAWRRVAGYQIVERSHPIELLENRLVVAVADITWKRNLESLAPQLLFKLNAALGRVTVNFIEFRVQPSAIEKAACIDDQYDDSETKLPSELANAAKAIRDEKLRKTVMLAAANCLARPS
jgi:hypothetical protein